MKRFLPSFSLLPLLRKQQCASDFRNTAATDGVAKWGSWPALGGLEPMTLSAVHRRSEGAKYQAEFKWLGWFIENRPLLQTPLWQYTLLIIKFWQIWSLFQTKPQQKSHRWVPRAEIGYTVSSTTWYMTVILDNTIVSEIDKSRRMTHLQWTGPVGSANYTSDSSSNGFATTDSQLGYEQQCRFLHVVYANGLFIPNVSK